MGYKVNNSPEIQKPIKLSAPKKRTYIKRSDDGDLIDGKFVNFMKHFCRRNTSLSLTEIATGSLTRWFRMSAKERLRYKKPTPYSYYRYCSSQKQRVNNNNNSQSKSASKPRVRKMKIKSKSKSNSKSLTATPTPSPTKSKTKSKIANNEQKPTENTSE